MELHAVTHCITLSSEELDIIKDVIVLRIDEIEKIEDPEERKEVEKLTPYTLLTKIHAAMYLYLDE
jgi:hypothetical protein